MTQPPGQKRGEGAAGPSRGSHFVFLMIALLVFVIIWSTFSGRSQLTLSYSEYLDLIEQGQIRTAVVHPDTLEVTGEFNGTERRGGGAYTSYRVRFPTSEALDRVTQKLIEEEVKVETSEPSVWTNLFSPQMLILILLVLGPLVLIFWLFSRQMQVSGQSQAFNFGKSRAQLYEGKVGVTFKDVAGVEEAKEELAEVVDFLKNPKKYTAMGAQIPKGILLVGPPGTGKTLLARAVAGEAGVPFFYISGSDFVEMFVGVGAARVRDLFDQAKKRRPCLVFIDELDAVGRRRGAGIGGGHDEREQTLNQLLVELDGFEANSGIIVLAATNRPDVLDPALLRPGRFDRRVIVDRPDIKGRIEILKIHLRDKPVGQDVDVAVLARRTPGFTGADLRNVCNEAALLAARRGKTQITMEEFDEAIDKVMAGPERKSRVITEKEKRLVAYHELGHAITAWALPHADPVHKISILPRGLAQGYTVILPEEDRYFATREEMMDRISALLGGRVAEELVFGEISTGASNDLERATEIARDMVTVYGMSDHLGPISYGKRGHEVFLGKDLVEQRNYSDQIAYLIDQEVRRIVDDCYDQAREVLKKYLPHLHFLAEVIMDREHLRREEFEAIMESFDPDNPPQYRPGGPLPIPPKGGKKKPPAPEVSPQQETKPAEGEDFVPGPAPA